jgi:hypothetical protein
VKIRDFIDNPVAGERRFSGPDSLVVSWTTTLLITYTHSRNSCPKQAGVLIRDIRFNS